MNALVPEGMLDQLASAPTFREAAETLIDWARELTGCRAGMLRLREHDEETGDWIPAVVERGFGCRFLRDEVLIGAAECMCGRVSRGCPDERFPFFTPSGAFCWGQVQSIADDFPVQSMGSVRGTCISEGFESIAIVPIVVEGDPVGCLHLADEAKNRFAGYMEALEEAGRVCGPLLLRFSAQEREASLIDAVETALAPAELPEVEGLDLAVTYTSATTAANLGGDFYDVFVLENGDTLLVVGDYCGKGLGAAGMAARARQAVGVAAADADTLEALFAEAEKVVIAVMPPERFVTLVACRYSPGGRLQAAIAGHPSPLLLDGRGEMRELSLPGNPPLGFLAEKRFDIGQGRVGATETLLLYTDGITESRSGGRFFGLEGIARVWREKLGSGPHELTAALCRVSADFHDADDHGDDRLALAVRVAAPCESKP